jgi:hypothetical protein
MFDSYVMNLKVFIDENITLNTDSHTITWIVQQYLLVHHYLFMNDFKINSYFIYSITF